MLADTKGDSVVPEKSFAAGLGSSHPIFLATCTVVVIGGAKLAAPVLVPFFLSLFIAIVLLAPVKALTSRGVPHWLSVLVVMSAALLFFAAIFFIVGAATTNFAADLPEYKLKFGTLTATAAVWFDENGVDVSAAGLQSALHPEKLISYFQTFIGDIGNMLGSVLLITLTVIFMISDSALYSRKLAARGRRLGRSAEELAKLSALFRSLSVYTKIMAEVSLLTGVLIWLGLTMMGVKYPVLWGLLAFLLNFIPTIGSIIAAVPVLLLALISQDVVLLMMIIGLYLAVNVVVGNFLQPVWMGGEVGLSTISVFLSMVFWGWLFGPVGMFLSVPLTIVLRYVTMRNPSTRWLSILLSNESGDDTNVSTEAKPIEEVNHD